ncbi:MAG: hypothetical protein GEV11_13700 [Streptosporangiales bacterium]|nr:hypothetical protein [Streptosporangiales bacterium]
MPPRDGRRVARLRRALADREARVAELKQRLDALEGSTSIQLGRVLTTAARRPGRGITRLPADLYRLWRGRRVGGRTKLPKPQPVRQVDLSREEDRLIVGGAVLGTSGPLIAGVLAPSATAALTGCARVLPLLPHDAELLLDTAEPDLLLVTASASVEPGSAWANVGDPAAGDLERVLHRVIAAARARGVPVVLWRDAASPPGLHRLDYDWIAEGDLGIPLHLTEPTALPATASATIATAAPATIAAAAPATGAATAAATGPTAAGTGGGTAAGEGGGRSGMPSDALGGASADAVGGTAAGLIGEREVRVALRRIFAEGATPVRLAALLAQVVPGERPEVPVPPEGHGLAVRVGVGGDPLAGRRVTVVARVGDDARAAAVAGEVAAQTHPAAELILLVPDERAAAGAEPPTFGLPARVLPERGFTAARTVRTPWMAPWPDADPGPDHLLDMMAAAECSCADAVGDDGTGRSYAFTAGPITPALIRRGLDGEPADWTARGVRQYAVTTTKGLTR